MKKLTKSLFSIEVMTVLLLLMAFTCAIATFIENDFGPLGSKSFVYGQTWFETIMLLLTIGVVFNIIWFKMYKKDKFFILMIHTSFIFIFLGATLTRYMGYEGIMTIPEGRMENRILSTDEYVQMQIKKGNKTYNYDTKVLMTPLNQTKFNDTIKLDEQELTITFKEYVENAIDKIVPDYNGVPMVNVLISSFSGTKSIDLINSALKDTKFLTFTLNKETKSNKPTVNFSVDKYGRILYKSNIKTAWFDTNTNEEGVLAPNEETKLKTTWIFKVGQTQFMIPEAQAKGKLKTVTAAMGEVKKDKQENAVILDLNYQGIKKELTLFAKGGANRGFIKNIKFEDLDISLEYGAKTITIPFALKLLDFQLERYPGSNSPSTYLSDVEIVDKEIKENAFYRIYMNNTLDYKGYRFFQSSYKMDESATILSVNKDPGKIPTYIGYFLLFTGLFLNLFTKKGRFRKLSSKKYTVDDMKRIYQNKKMKMVSVLFLAVFFVQPNNIFANENDIINTVTKIDKTHADYFGKLLIQDYQGRIKPMNSLAIEIINKLTRKSEIYGLNANQFFISLMIYPQKWQELRFIRVKDKKLKKILGINEDEKTFAFKDIYNKDGSYKLKYILENANNKKPAQRGTFDKDIIKVDERLNIAYGVFTGDFFKAFPKAFDENNKWVSPLAIKTVLNEKGSTDIALDYEEAKKLDIILEKYLKALTEAANESKDWNKATFALKDIQLYQKEYAEFILPNEWKIKAELFFNKYNIFERLTPYYLILGFTLLITVFITIFKPALNIKKFTFSILILLGLGFVFHTFGLGLRWYVSGHAPWSNGYESMIYIAWAIVLSGMFFSKQSNLALATTGILSGITLFVAHLSWMEPQITTLAPVLKSYWLTIHVSVITASYGFLGLSALLGFISLLMFAFANPKKENETFFNILLSIKESNRINEMSILIGLVLLVIGNFLGGIWANESWGRYWGWDPKETWTLVSILIYAAIIHLKYIKGMLTDYTLAVLSLISYSSIIMTYFGVNYYLSGKHSYAAGDPVPIPTFVPISAIVIFIVIVIAYRNRKVI